VLKDIDLSKENISKSQKSIKLKSNKSALEHDQSYIDSVRNLIKKLPEIKLERQKNSIIPKIIDIKKIIQTDAHILNFGTFLVGKILACNLKVTNISSEDIELNIDIENYEFISHTGLPSHNLTSHEMMGTNPINSEFKYKCWHLEDPTSKDLTKSLKLIIEKESTASFLIILKTPKVKRSERLYSIISLSKHSDSDHLIQKPLRIVLHGFIETPKLVCCRELNILGGELQLIPLAVKKEIGINRFRIPFKNQGNFDLNIECLIEKIPNINFISGIEYIVLPNKFKIASKAFGILNLAVKCAKTIDTSTKEQKLLTIKLSESPAVYTFILETTII